MLGRETGLLIFSPNKRIDTHRPDRLNHRMKVVGNRHTGIRFKN